MSAQTPEQILKEHDLRVTAPRLAVLKALSGAHPVVTMEEIHQKCGLKKIDFATVYRSIQTFLELGIVESVELGDGSIRYELCNADDEHHHHHHHVVCVRCKRIEAIENCGVPHFEKELRAMGYRDIQHRLEFQALCKRCQ